MFSNKTVIGPLLLSLTLLLSGCGTTALQRPGPPPPELLERCPEPSPPNVAVNGDFIRLLPEWRRALDNCNAQLDALREWAKE